MTEEHSFAVPRSVPVFAALLAITGSVAAVLSSLAFQAPAIEWLAVGPFLALLTAAAYLIVRFQRGEEVEALDLFEAVLAPVLFVFPGWLVVCMVAFANAAAERVHGIRSIKAVFNVCQWVAAAGIGSLVLAVLRQGDAVTWRNVGALVAAMASVTLVNYVALATVLVLSERKPLASIPAGLRSLAARGWLAAAVLNLAFGLLFVAAYQVSSATIVLFVVPLFALKWAHRAHAVARADEMRLQALHRASAILSAAVDPLDTIDEFLEEVRACFEAEAAEIVFVDGTQLTTHQVPAGHRPLAAPLIRSLLSLTEPARVTAQAAHPEGWRDCLAAPLVDDGDAIGVLCTYNRTGLEGFDDGELSVLAALAADIVAALQRGALVDRVVDERRKLRDIVRRASDGIFTMSIDGTVTNWNPAMEEITGHRVDDMVGRAGFGILRPRDADGSDVILERWATIDDALPAHLQILTKVGERRWLSCSYSRATEPNGDGETLVVIARDVTKVREVERLREDFVATVSHELRTPLSPIKGWASTLLQYGDTLPPEDRRAAIESILRQSQRLERLIVNLLEVSKIEHGIFEAADADVDMGAVVNRVVGEFEKTSPDRAFTVDAHGMFCARAKELWVEQIVTNLMSNAVKYSPAGESINVTMSHHDGRVRVAVTDHGCGIPAHELERVFERFHRVQETTTQTGTGLGLYIARQLAEEMDGAISVQSAPGSGSTFVLDLPAVPHVVDVRVQAEIIELEAG